MSASIISSRDRLFFQTDVNIGFHYYSAVAAASHAHIMLSYLYNNIRNQTALNRPLSAPMDSHASIYIIYNKRYSDMVVYLPFFLTARDITAFPPPMIAKHIPTTCIYKHIYDISIFLMKNADMRFRDDDWKQRILCVHSLLSITSVSLLAWSSTIVRRSVIPSLAHSLCAGSIALNNNESVVHRFSLTCCTWDRSHKSWRTNQSTLRAGLLFLSNSLGATIHKR